MSRYTFAGNDLRHRIVVGWDDPLQSFFGQVEDLAYETNGAVIDPQAMIGDCEEEGLLVWVGADGVPILDVNQLVAAVAAYGTIPEGVLVKLRADQTPSPTGSNMVAEEQPGRGDEGALALAFEISLALALATGAVANACYANAWETIFALTGWPDLRLVEGWLVLEQASQVTIIEHCWCEHDGLIVDPSIVLLAPQRSCLQAHYFAGVHRDRAELQTLVCRDLPYVRASGNYGPDGLEHAEYRAAYDAAYGKATQLARASSPEKAVVIQPAAFPATEEARLDLTVQIVSSQTFLHHTGE